MSKLMVTYLKLVRNQIPAIIAASGRNCEWIPLPPDAFVEALVKKLREELEEYEESKNPLELADIIEVIYALLPSHGLSPDELEQMRVSKNLRNGNFSDRILLVKVSDPS